MNSKGFSCIGMDSKGFTLFTALVSFVLIALAFVLIQSMIEAERASAETIETIDEQTEMQSIADLARADAIQVFNVGVRYQFELWITDKSNEFYIMDIARAGSWQEMIDDFAAAELGSKEIIINGKKTSGSEQLANRMANHLTATLSTGGALQAYSFKGYDVWLQISENPNNPNDSTQMKNILKTTINTGVEKHTLLEPVECNESECNLGTFYINMDLTQLDFKEYSNLPQIVVKSHATGRVIKQPILPKGNLRAFVPLRLFKALWKARKIAGIIDDFGKQKNSLNLGLGMCDDDCSVRTNPQGGSNGTIAINPQTFPLNGKLCPGTQNTANMLVDVDCTPPEECPATDKHWKGKYLVNEPNDMANVLRRFVSNTGASAFENIDPAPDDGLQLWNAESAPAGNRINANTETIETKKIIKCSRIASGGLNCSPTSNEGTAVCVKFTGLEVVLEFTETMQEFKVNKARPENNYKIKMVADYTQQSQNKQECKSVTETGGFDLFSGIPTEKYSCEE